MAVGHRADVELRAHEGKLGVKRAEAARQYVHALMLKAHLLAQAVENAERLLVDSGAVFVDSHRWRQHRGEHGAVLVVQDDYCAVLGRRREIDVVIEHVLVVNGRVDAQAVECGALSSTIDHIHVAHVVYLRIVAVQMDATITTVVVVGGGGKRLPRVDGGGVERCHSGLGVQRLVAVEDTLQPERGRRRRDELLVVDARSLPRRIGRGRRRRRRRRQRRLDRHRGRTLHVVVVVVCRRVVGRCCIARVSCVGSIRYANRHGTVGVHEIEELERADLRVGRRVCVRDYFEVGI